MEWWQNQNSPLSEIAAKQFGAFSALQAVDAGISADLHDAKVTNGEWKRELPGIYSLTSCERDFLKTHYQSYYLWTSDEKGKPQGVFGYSTALGLFKLPEPWLQGEQMIVPLSFKPIYDLPETNLRLFYEDLDSSRVCDISGVKATKPLYTILDFIKWDHGDRMEVRRALDDSLREKLFTMDDINNANLTVEERRLMDQLIEELPWIELDDGIG
jgi:hypothetical protein